MAKTKYNTPERCKELAAAINEGRIVANITSVAKSGMSRKMKFSFIKDNRLYPCTHNFAEAFGYKLTKHDEIRIMGCGMNMIFWAIDYMAIELTSAGYPCKYTSYQTV